MKYVQKIDAIMTPENYEEHWFVPLMIELNTFLIKYSPQIQQRIIPLILTN